MTLPKLFLGVLLGGAVFSAGWGQSSSSEKMPWQIGSSALSGIQHNPVIFLSPAQLTIAANHSSLVELHFRIADGLHINSHAPHDASLIPTQMLVADSDGLTTTAMDFPTGTDATLSFAPNQKLNVYTGEFVVKAHVTAKPGEHQWQAVMRYQACDNSECMPPKKVPVSVDLTAK